MVAYFRRLGHDAFLITSVYHDGKEVVDANSLGERGYVQVDDHELGIPIIRVGSFTSRWPPRRIGFKDEMKTLEEIVNAFHFNVLITHSTLWNGPEEVAKFVEWRRNIKALGGFRDPLIFCHMSHFQEPSPRRYSLVERSYRLAWNKLALRTILRVANLVLVVTPYEEDAKEKMGAPKDRLILFPGGIDDDVFANFATSDPNRFKQRMKISDDAGIVTYLGTVEERKNPKAVLDVAESLAGRANIHFVLAGEGDSEYATEVRRRAGTLPNVTYLGAVSDEEKIELIRSSHLNLILSRMEALGLTQLEFMFQGIPVITSGVGGQSWLIRHEQEGLHVNGPDDVKGAVDAISQLFDDCSKWEKLSTNARNRAKEFTLTKLIDNFDGAITEEMVKETGLSKLPVEVQSTISEPEVVERNWSRGSRRIIATNKRIFIQEGKISKKTMEIPYENIKSIEYTRSYRWRTLITGAALSSLLFIQHYFFPVISRTITSRLGLTLISLLPAFRPELLLIMGSLWVVPFSIAVLLFMIKGRVGFALQGATLKPVYLPPSFRETIPYIREMLDAASSHSEQTTSV
jgi:glycosyltransferase involved in cell wall biosynthesis